MFINEKIVRSIIREEILNEVNEKLNLLNLNEETKFKQDQNYKKSKSNYFIVPGTPNRKSEFEKLSQNIRKHMSGPMGIPKLGGNPNYITASSNKNKEIAIDTIISDMASKKFKNYSKFIKDNKGKSPENLKVYVGEYVKQVKDMVAKGWKNKDNIIKIAEQEAIILMDKKAGEKVKKGKEKKEKSADGTDWTEYKKKSSPELDKKRKKAIENQKKFDELDKKGKIDDAIKDKMKNGWVFGFGNTPEAAIKDYKLAGGKTDPKPTRVIRKKDGKILPPIVVGGMAEKDIYGKEEVAPEDRIGPTKKDGAGDKKTKVDDKKGEADQAKKKELDSSFKEYLEKIVNKKARHLKKGRKGKPIGKLQEFLTSLGIETESDDDFGSKTRASVQKFQRSKGLDDDGVVGPKTAAAILKTTPGEIKPKETEDTKGGKEPAKKKRRRRSAKPKEQTGYTRSYYFQQGSPPSGPFFKYDLTYLNNKLVKIKTKNNTYTSDNDDANTKRLFDLFKTSGFKKFMKKQDEVGAEKWKEQKEKEEEKRKRTERQNIEKEKQKATEEGEAIRRQIHTAKNKAPKNSGETIYFSKKAKTWKLKADPGAYWKDGAWKGLDKRWKTDMGWQGIDWKKKEEEEAKAKKAKAARDAAVEKQSMGSFRLEEEDRITTIDGKKVSFQTGKYRLKGKRMKPSDEDATYYFWGPPPANQPYLFGKGKDGKPRSGRYWAKGYKKKYYDYLMKLFMKKTAQ